MSIRGLRDHGTGAPCWRGLYLLVEQSFAHGPGNGAGLAGDGGFGHDVRTGGAIVSTVGSQVVCQFELTYLSSSGKGIEWCVELAIELQGRFQCDGKSHENHSAKR